MSRRLIVVLARGVRVVGLTVEDRAELERNCGRALCRHGCHQSLRENATIVGDLLTLWLPSP